MANIARNYNVNQGADFELMFTFKDRTGAPLDLTGNVFTGMVKRRAVDLDAVAVFTWEILDQAQFKGKVRARLSATETSKIPCDSTAEFTTRTTNFFYDMRRQRSDGRIVRFREGQLVVSPGVTR